VAGLKQAARRFAVKFIQFIRLIWFT